METDLDRLDPNQLRRKKAEALDRAREYNVQADAPTLDPEERAALEAKADAQIEKAQSFESRAQAYEAREARAQGRRLSMLELSQTKAVRATASNEAVMGRRSVFSADSPRVRTRDLMAADPATLDNGGFNSLTELVRAIRDQRSGTATDERLQYLAAGQNTESGPDGGFLVPDFYQQAIVTTASADEPWLNMLNRTTLRNGVGGVHMPVLADRDASSEDTAGVTLTRVGETGTIPISAVKFESNKSELHKCGTRIRMSNELLNDSPNVQDAVDAVIARAVSTRQALDVINGTGVGEPLGLVESAATYVVAKEGSQTADTINGVNIVEMRARLSPVSLAKSIWLAHPDTLAQLLNDHTSLTNNDYPLFIHGNGTDVPDTLMGRPIYFTSAANSLGDKGDIVLFNPGVYNYISRPVKIDVSSQFRFDTDETELRVILRDEGRPLYQQTHTDLRGYETSEYVTLAERA
ncbi:MAG: phage major capsid protein [Planctomycetota bacterium]